MNLKKGRVHGPARGNGVKMDEIETVEQKRGGARGIECPDVQDGMWVDTP
jgi:hypothetical protein